MLKKAYLLAKIGADTAENERNSAANERNSAELAKIFGRSTCQAPRSLSFRLPAAASPRSFQLELQLVGFHHLHDRLGHVVVAARDEPQRRRADDFQEPALELPAPASA